VIEDTLELNTFMEDSCSRLETDDELSLSDLVKNSLRMRPERIIVGEVRGAEARDMITAVNIGKYCMGTIHALSARETITRLPPQTNHLKEFEWLVGDWASETSKAGITLRTSCDWTANQAFLIRKFHVDGKEAILHGGTEIIGWDPRTNRVRSWIFDADGGFGENVWVHDGNRWLIKFSGTLADGSETSATHILTKVDDTTFMLQSKDRVVSGAAQPDIPATKLKRQVETKPAAKTEEPTKSVEKPAP